MPKLRRVRIAYFNRATGVTNDVAEFETERELSEYESEEIGVLEVGEDFDPTTHWIKPDTLEIVAYSPAGAERRRNFTNPGGFRWDPPTETWIDERALPTAIAAAWAAVQSRRAVAFDSMFTASNGVPFIINRDKGNLGDVIRVRDEGAVPPEAITMWKAQDGNFYQLDRAGLARLAFDMGQRGEAIFGNSWLLEALVKSATDKDDLAAIDLEYGWE